MNDERYVDDPTNTWDSYLQEMAGWETCLETARTFPNRYSLWEQEQAAVYRQAMKLGPGQVAVEVGICNGKTSAVLAYAARERGFEAFGVDAFLLDSNPDEIRARMKELDLPFTLFYARTSPEPIPQRPGLPLVEWSRPIDFLIIDASHTDPWVSSDHDFWLPFVKPGGFVAFHDINCVRSNPAGPHEDAYRAMVRDTSDWCTESVTCSRFVIKSKPNPGVDPPRW